MSDPRSGGGMFMLLMGGFAVWYGWTRDVRPKEPPDSAQWHYRSGAGIELQNISASQGAGLAHRAKVGRLANALTVEGGGKSTFLAGGMDETTAYGLLRGSFVLEWMPAIGSDGTIYCALCAAISDPVQKT